MKGFPTKYQLELKIAPILSMDYSSCNTCTYFDTYTHGYIKMYVKKMFICVCIYIIYANECMYMCTYAYINTGVYACI